MAEQMLIGLASVIVLGVLAQWLAWRLQFPSILLLLLTGIVAGPLTGLLNPDEVLGDTLYPFVSLSVAIVLFEGGLSLRLTELRVGGKVIRNLVTVGILVTWVLSAIAARYVAGLNWNVAILLGAVLVVSGPTVIVPLLRQVRPRGTIASIIKWEGIVNDPIGAILAVLVFEAILAGGVGAAASVVLGGVLRASFFGVLIGLGGAALCILVLHRYWVPDYLQSPFALMLVVVTYLGAHGLQTEGGLLAVTVMGMVLANQKFVSIQHILEFKENLRVLLIACLFIVLAARLPGAELFTDPINWLFVAILIVIIRPAMVFVSTLGSSLKLPEKLFLAWMAPRGIVAAAVASVFALRLEEAGFGDSSGVVHLTFQVIIGTVAVYGLTAGPLARRLKLSQAKPQGVLFAGASPWVRELARILSEEGFRVVLVDTNRGNIADARIKGFAAFYGSILSEETLAEIPLDGTGRLLAMTPNDEVNALAALHFVEVYSRSEVYQLAPSGTDSSRRTTSIPIHLRGRYLFSERASFAYLDQRFRNGAVLKKHSITTEFGIKNIRERYGSATVPLFVIDEHKSLIVVSAGSNLNPKPGSSLISLVDPSEPAQSTAGTAEV